MKKKHYLLFLLASLFLLTDVGWAQTSATVSGVVIDENGETLPGVSVVEVGTTNGVLTADCEPAYRRHSNRNEDDDQKD